MATRAALYVSKNALVAIIYFSAALVIQAIARGTPYASDIWPASGIAVLALYFWGTHCWPGLYVGAFASVLFSGIPVPYELALAAGKTFSAIVAVTALRYGTIFDRKLVRLQDVVVVAIIAALHATMNTLLGMSIFMLSGLVNSTDIVTLAKIWWAGDALGIVLLFPCVIAWVAEFDVRYRGLKLLELICLYVGTAVTSLVVLTHILIDWDLAYQGKYLIFPFFVWAALRFGLREISSMAVYLGTISLWSVFHNVGPFGAGDFAARLLWCAVFLGVVGISSLLLCVFSAQRRRSLDELRRLLDEKERLMCRLESANRSLTEFAYVASHDLRAPLRSIDQLAKFLSEGLKDALVGESREQMDLLRNRVRRMDKLLSDLLEYARAGDTPMHTAHVSLRRVVNEVIDLSNVPQGFSIDTHLEIDQAVTASMPLRQVLLNLVSNALKHHDCAQGTIVISATEEAEFICFRIADDGPGIPPEYRELVFEMFQTLKSRDVVEGSGMGLALVKKLVEQAGGTVAIEENSGRGAVFRVLWPKQWPVTEPVHKPLTMQLGMSIRDPLPH